MNDSYIRMLEAARELRAWNTPAEVARGLSAGGFTVSDQVMTNWKSRGISAEGVLESSRIIGCRCEFIRAGNLPIADCKPSIEAGNIANRCAFIIDAMTPEEQLKILHYLQVLKEQNAHQ